MEATGGRCAEAVIEAVGADATINDAIMSAAPGGTVSVIGVSMNFGLPMPMPVLLFKRLTFRVTLASIPTTWGALFPLVASGKLHPADVFTPPLGLSDPPEAYLTFHARAAGPLTVLPAP